MPTSDDDELDRQIDQLHGPGAAAALDKAIAEGRFRDVSLTTPDDAARQAAAAIVTSQLRIARLETLVDRHRDDLDEANRRIEMVLALHRSLKRSDHREWCEADGRFWPCPTVKALTGETDGD